MSLFGKLLRRSQLRRKSWGATKSSLQPLKRQPPGVRLERLRSARRMSATREGWASRRLRKTKFELLKRTPIPGKSSGSWQQSRAIKAVVNELLGVSAPLKGHASAPRTPRSARVGPSKK
jgi:hypothetical protein